MNYGFIIDNRKCIGCHACTVACKSEHDVPLGVNRTWVKYIEKGQFPHTRRVFSVMRCNHCSEAPCVEICPVQALHYRDDGIVDFDNRRCIGCKACTQACPYDALYIDPNTYTAAKCNYCAHRIDLGLEPACVNVCPERAIISGDIDDPAAEISQLLSREIVTARKPEKGVRPKLFYINGDEASLKPVAAEPQSQYFWNSQHSGVGHFARYAEELIAKADPLQMAQQLNGPQGAGQPDSTSTPAAGLPQKSGEALPEKARRVYDAPSKGILWGWEVSAYVWTKAVAAGAFLIPFLASLIGPALPENSPGWVGAAGALIFLALTGALLVKDLDKPARFAYVLLRPHWSSWLVRGGYAITVYGGLATLWGAASYLNIPWLRDLAAWGGALFALITAVYTAFLFAQAKGRDFWQSPALALHMLVHAFLAGAAFFALVQPFLPVHPAWGEFLNSVLTAAIGVNLLILAVEMATPHPTLDAKKTVGLILNGPFRNKFWLGSVLIGNIVPLLLIWLGGVSLLPLTGALALIGMYINEHIWVRAPQMIPLS